MSQVVETLPSKQKALSSNASTAEREGEKERDDLIQYHKVQMNK
jgi:hypothetical protein